MQKQECHQKPVKFRVQTNDVVHWIADGSNTDCRCVSSDGYISDSNIVQAVALLLRISAQFCPFLEKASVDWRPVDNVIEYEIWDTDFWEITSQMHDN